MDQLRTRQKLSKESFAKVKQMIDSTDKELNSLGVTMFFTGGGSMKQAMQINPDLTKGEWRWLKLNNRLHDKEAIAIWQVKTYAAIYRLKGKSWKRRRYERYRENS